MDKNILFPIVLVIFVAILLYVGIRSKKNVNDNSDFILAGRGIGFWMSVLSIVSIGFAGTAISLNPYYTMLFGYGGSLLFGASVAVVGYCVYGIALGKFIRMNGAQTLPEWLEVRYGRTTRNVVSITTMIGLCGVLANNIMSMVSVISAYTGWPSWMVLTGAFAVILIFAYIAGMWGITTTGFAQMIIGIIIVPLFIVLCVTKFGGISYVADAWPYGNWLTTGAAGSMPVWKLTYPSVLTIYVLYAFFMVWGNSYYWTRVGTCRNAKTARSSFIVAGIVMMIVFYMTLSYLGVYGITELGGPEAGTGVYGAVSALFPPIVGCLTVIAAVAASISTAATSLIGATATASRDIYGRLLRPKATPEQQFKATKVIILLVALLTWIICLYPGGATTIFSISAAFLAPPAVLILLGNVFPSFNAKGATAGALGGGAVMLVLFILEMLHINPLSKIAHTGMVGLVVTVICCIIGGFFGKPKYFGQKSWSVKATATNRENIELEKQDYDILSMARIGHTHMSDFTDGLGRDAGDVSASLERLDRGGFIERGGLRWSKFYEIYITEKGVQALPALSAEDQKLCDSKLTDEYLTIMRKINEGMPALSAWAREHQIPSMKMSATICHLARNGYVDDSKGLASPQYILTEKGKQIIAAFQ